MAKLTSAMLAKQVQDLPMLPQTALKVMEMTKDPKSTVTQVAEVISRDQALTAKVLRMANSAFYGYARSIATITDAVVILGFRALRDLVLAASIHGIFQRELKGYAMAKGELWKHAVVCAFTARTLAGRIKSVNTDEVFVAALLHDIGKVILHTYVSEEFDKILHLVNHKKIPFTQAEMEVLGFDHAAVGALVAEKWNLPVTLVEAIAFHHEPAKATVAPHITAITHVADTVCMIMGVGLGADGLMYTFDQSVFDLLSITEQDIEKLIAEISDHLLDINSLLDL